MMLKRGATILSAACGYVDDDGVGEAEANDRLRLNLHLLAFRDGVGAGTHAAAGRCADGRSLAAAQDAAEDGADGSAAADLLRGVLAAAFTLLGVGIGCDFDVVALVRD